MKQPDTSEYREFMFGSRSEIKEERWNGLSAGVAIRPGSADSDDIRDAILRMVERYPDTKGLAADLIGTVDDWRPVLYIGATTPEDLEQLAGALIRSASWMRDDMK